MNRWLTLLLLFTMPPVAQAGRLEVKLVEARGGAVADAVVSLRPADGRSLPPLFPATGVELRQTGREFVPYVTAVPTGTSIILPNEDNVDHHAYSLSPALKFDLPLYKPGTRKSLEFKTPGVVTIGCNIHDWMIAYVVVLDTPWFAKSGESGVAPLADVPAGRYTATIWHPRLAKEVIQEITISADPATSQTVTLTLRPDRRIRRPADTTVGGYR